MKSSALLTVLYGSLINFKKIVTGVALWIVLTGLSNAIAKMPGGEPFRGFFTGPDPEWAPRHARFGFPEHKKYHRTKETDYGLWRSESGSLIKAEKREYLYDRNHNHRTFHDWQLPTRRQRQWKDANKEMLEKKETTGSGMVVTDEKLLETVRTRTYEGNRPSRRILQDIARVRGGIR